MKSIRFPRALLLAVATLFALGLAACSDDDDHGGPVAPDPSKSVRVDVGGYRLQAELRGTGTPTVVLLSGLDVPLEGWGPIQTALAQETRTLAYDRAGVARSDEAKDSLRDAHEIALELQRLLDGAELAPPYLLVAHSVAGYYARVYADRFPDRVAGLVLLDVQHEVEADLLREALLQQPDLLHLIASTLQFPGSRREVMATLESADQARAAGVLPRVPVAVVTNMKPDLEVGETAEHRQLMYDLHHGWVEQGSVGVHLVSHGGHMVPLSDPKTALEAIRWVMARISG